MLRKLAVILSLCFISGIVSIGLKDKVTLPGLTFKINYNVYSGYLNANENGTWKAHYWLVESKSSPSTDPLLVWIEGGPGCSALASSFEEIGPFYANIDGKNLFENKFSWNAKANLLFIESPIGVGFSYDTSNPDFIMSSDAVAAQQNYHALADFFNRVQPQYRNQTFFTGGQSYSGVFVPMLSALVTEGIKNASFPNANFKGMAIGNGLLNMNDNMNSQVVWSAYHAKISTRDWQSIKTSCGDGLTADPDKINYRRYLNTTNGMDFFSDGTECGDLVYKHVIQMDGIEAMNFYEDCWNPLWSAETTLKEKQKLFNFPSPIHHPLHRAKRAAMPNTATLFNYDSSDNQIGYLCWGSSAVSTYFNRPEVQEALHIDKAWRTKGNGTRQFQLCNGDLFNQYTLDFPDQQPFFEKIMHNTNSAFKILIYNGDVDSVCNYLGDAWFVDRLAAKENMTLSRTRSVWTYRDKTAGFVESFTDKSAKIRIDLLTVKGAGHLAARDRPSTSTQMITNFLTSTDQIIDYSSAKFIDPTPTLAPFVDEPSQPRPTQSARKCLRYSLILIIIQAIVLLV